MTLEQLASRVGEATGEGFTHASLSRIERGLQPYSQAVLEALADALQTDPASLLIRDPSDPEGIWSIWDQAKPGQREMIVEMAHTVIKRQAG
jgi:transcriptional regulator with XRE-family HTH domain